MVQKMDILSFICHIVEEADKTYNPTANMCNELLTYLMPLIASNSYF